MRIVSFLSILCVAFFTHFTVSFAQTYHWTIVTAAHDTLRSCVIGKMEGDVCNFICEKSVIHISADSLNILSRHKESHFWRGAGNGTLIGFAVGALVGVATYQNPAGSYAIDPGPGVAALGGAILGGVAGFTIGGIIGATSGGEETYYLSGKSAMDKIRILQSLRNENK